MKDARGSFLVTTSLEETWPTEGPIDYLGKWCLVESRRDVWDRRETRVVPYHWDDRQRLFDDQQYLQRLYEKLLIELKEELGDIHGIERSIRHWRIILGPWLNLALAVIFDRWTSIREYVTENGHISTILLTDVPTDGPVNDMAEFSAIVQQPKWNHKLYSELLIHRPDIKVVFVSDTSNRPTPTGEPARGGVVSGYLRIWRSLEKIATRLTSRDSIVMTSTYLSRREEMTLCAKFRQLPMTRTTLPTPKVGWEPNTRDWALHGPSDSAFEEWARRWIPQNIPRVYLEGYQELVDCSKSMRWPRNPDLIWTSGSFNSDDVFKSWAAECVEAGTALVIGQHGGVYGLAKWSSTEDHEISISDRYLTWGWKDENEETVCPVGVLRPQVWLELEDRKPCNVLMVLGAGPRQVHRMFAGPVAGQWSNYFEDQCQFIEALSGEVRACLVVRPDRSYLGANGSEQLIERIPDIVIDEGTENIREEFQKTKLLIVTYNGSSMLEALSMDIPTLIWLDPAFWEFRKSSVATLEQLREVGIFHNCRDSAIQHISEIWNDIEGWWDRSSVQAARKTVSENYARRPTELLTQIEMVLRDTIVMKSR